MLNIETPLGLARRQAARARAQADRQQALVDALACQGLDCARARRVLTELTLCAELLEDRAAHLQDAAAGMADVRPRAPHVGDSRDDERELAAG